jgi:transcriptional regulator with XRE-family HTH domain
VPVRVIHRFGKNLRRIRLERGFTQEKLAELADVHWTFVGKVERGEVNLSLRNIARFAIGLKCKPEELVSGIL